MELKDSEKRELLPAIKYALAEATDADAEAVTQAKEWHEVEQLFSLEIEVKYYDFNIILITTAGYHHDDSCVTIIDRRTLKNIGEGFQFHDSIVGDITLHPEHLPQTPEDIKVTCVFCHKAVQQKVAMDSGWIPYFWSAVHSASISSACPECADEHLEYFEADLEWVEPKSN